MGASYSSRRVAKDYADKIIIPIEIDSANMKEKFCTQCRQWLPIGMFSLNTGRPDGKRSRCRECDSLNRRIARAKERLNG